MNRKSILTLAFIMAVLAFCLLMYPIASQLYWENHSAVIYTEYHEKVNTSNDEEKKRLWAMAQAYNRSLQPGLQSDIDALSAAYAEQLDLTGSGTMGWIEIPCIGVRLPIYHGTAANTLEKGIGHLLGSSLPVGGTGSHCVLTGHSGMAGKKMFSDLPQLQIGDLFYLDVLGQRLAYQVFDIETILPHDIESLSIQPEKDLVTLITCVPFGVNTHRLLVKGCRIPYEPAEDISHTQQELSSSDRPSNWLLEYERNILLWSGFVFLLLLIVRNNTTRKL